MKTYGRFIVFITTLCFIFPLTPADADLKGLLKNLEPPVKSNTQVPSEDPSDLSDDTIIKGLKEKGYEIVPISELIYRGECEMDHEGRQCPPKV